MPPGALSSPGTWLRGEKENYRGIRTSLEGVEDVDVTLLDSGQVGSRGRDKLNLSGLDKLIDRRCGLGNDL